MRLSPIAKLAVFLVIASALYYAWNHLVSEETRAQVRERLQTARRDGSSAPPARREPTTPEPTSRSERQAPTAKSGGSGDILFITTAAKRDWVQQEVERFNADHQGRWRIVPRAQPSREAMHDILDGKVQPVLWSPGGSIWPARLAEAWREKHSTPILQTTDPNAYRVFLRSPLVFLTTRRKAEFLRPLLGGTRPWGSMRELSLGKRRTPWGRFRFSHADPLTSSSGMLTFALILNEYNGEGGDPVQVAEGPGFARYLREMERALVYDEAARKGTTALAQAFLEDMSRYDVITAYESAALEAAPTHPDLAVIYPNPTAFSEHAVTLLDGEWVTPAQREGAVAFLEFLGSESAQRDGLKYSFRPARASTLSLGERLRAFRGQGFKQSVTSIELPPYRALNSAAYMFRTRIAQR